MTTDLWSKVFCPRTWEEAAYPPSISRIKEWANDIKTPYCRVVIVHGPPGRGKTTLAHLLSKDFEVVEEVNASDRRRRHEFQCVLQRVTDSIHRKKSMLFILDEADGMQDSQFAFLSWLTTLERWYVKHGESSLPRVRILILCNDFSALEPGLASRAWVLRVGRPSAETMRQVCLTTLSKLPGSYEFTPALVDHLISYADGDFRVLVNLMQQVISTADSITEDKRRILDVDDISYITGAYPKDILRVLFHPSLKTVPLEQRYECLTSLWCGQGVRTDEFIGYLKWMQRMLEPDVKKVGCVARFIADLHQRAPRSVLGLHGSYSRFLAQFIDCN